MHETGLVRNLIQKVTRIAEDADAHKVVNIKVSLGALAHMSETHFRDHFYQEATGTIAEGADLIVELLDDVHDPEAQSILLHSVDIEE